ncbi:hypothetical protein [Halalkalibacter oceani]|uniref:Lipoprotein n=1 Tax=Halalkalibacter oceani TaxID=1653776 RepID=A0A9X2DNF0_9BACI|nr:hypothetical protein [Halalkalibacter oceani]MCM3713686.1 hypothetical protein [Halalkalibacter oceani]MCM3762927.1 hypothetical protein [Halalkalibacter oceani]
MKHVRNGLVLCLLLAGCQSVANPPDIQPLSLEDQAVIEQQQADEAKRILLSMEEIVEVKGVNDGEDNIYLAPEVKHFDRFRLKEIRKQSHDRVKKRYPEANVHVSTDKKIFLELGRLEQELKEKKISEKRLTDELTKLEDKMKG